MEEKEYIQLCHALAKALNTAVRLYRGRERRYYYSVYHLHPDPAGPYLEAMLEEKKEAGVFATPLYQFYAHVALEGEWRLILGPSRIQNEDARLERELLFLLGVSEERQEEYLRILRCVPAISAERMGWLMRFLCLAVNRREPGPEELFSGFQTGEPEAGVRRQQLRQAADPPEGDAELDRHRLEYNAERLLLSYVENGEPEKIREMFSAALILAGGPMADNTLRQVKNTCICAAILAARAAIAGGLDDAVAFRLSDLYIQRVELTRELPALEKLREAILIDFAQQVRQVRYHISLTDGGKSIFQACAEYVAQNLYTPIRAEEMARRLGYSRSYLCSRFKRQTGMTITQFPRASRWSFPSP